MPRVNTFAAARSELVWSSMTRRGLLALPALSVARAAVATMARADAFPQSWNARWEQLPPR